MNGRQARAGPAVAPKVVGPGFRGRVYAKVREVPPGAVTTYGDVAGALGSRRVARHVGFALSALPPDTDVPWHRVINGQGRISVRGDSVRADVQRTRLLREGIAFDPRGRVVDFAAVRHRFDAPDIDGDPALL